MTSQARFGYPLLMQTSVADRVRGVKLRPIQGVAENEERDHDGLY